MRNAAPKVRRLDNSLAITRESFHILILAGYTEGAAIPGGPAKGNLG